MIVKKMLNFFNAGYAMWAYAHSVRKDPGVSVFGAFAVNRMDTMYICRLVGEMNNIF